MRYIAYGSICAMLLLMTSCSNTESPEEMTSGEPVAVVFRAAMQPTVELTRALITDTTLPATETAGEQVGIYGVVTDGASASTYDWKSADAALLQENLCNSPYIVEADNTLSPEGDEAYYPLGTDNPALAIYAYWPYNSETTLQDGKGAVLPIDLTTQTDILYTGKVVASRHLNSQVDLPFKHALGGLQFKFHTSGTLLARRQLTSLEIVVPYALDDINMRVADGTFTAVTEKDGAAVSSTLTVPLNTTMAASEEEAVPVGATLLLPGMDVSQIILHTTDATGMVTYRNVIYDPTDATLADRTFEVEAGKLVTLIYEFIEGGNVTTFGLDIP